MKDLSDGAVIEAVFLSFDIGPGLIFNEGARVRSRGMDCTVDNHAEDFQL